jgi:hypothetical protein
MTDFVTTRNLIVAYFTVGAVVCLVHPLLIREEFAELRRLDLGAAGLICKPIMTLLVFLLFCALWPIAWFNAGKSEKKAKQKLDAQLERLRPFAKLYTAMNAPARYNGGDGLSFDHAVVIVGATLISGPRAEHNFIQQHYPGYQFHRQSLQERNGRSYDVLEFTTADGETKTMYFDISAHLPTNHDDA